jgi:hypothetical protein
VVWWITAAVLARRSLLQSTISGDHKRSVPDADVQRKPIFGLAGVLHGTRAVRAIQRERIGVLPHRVIVCDTATRVSAVETNPCNDQLSGGSREVRADRTARLTKCVGGTPSLDVVGALWPFIPKETIVRLDEILTVSVFAGLRPVLPQ